MAGSAAPAAAGAALRIGEYMKVLVVSDSHGRNDLLRQAIGQEAPIDLLIHAGDVEGDLKKILGEETEYKIKVVAGNMDRSAEVNASLAFDVGAHRVFLTHGHHYGVHYTASALVDMAKKCKADVAIFGHTHMPVREKEDGVLLLNPGSIAKPRQGPDKTYIVIQVDDKTGEWDLKFKKLPRQSWF